MNNLKLGIYLCVIYISIIAGYSQEIEDTKRIINDINNLLNPKAHINFNKGIFTVNYYRNNDLIKISKLNIDEIIPSDISYSTNSKQIVFQCQYSECVENKFLGNIKKKTFTPRLKIFVEDTLKGRKVLNLMKIVIGEKNKSNITKTTSPGLEYKLSHNLVSTMPLLLFWGGFGVSYEYITTSEKLGVYIPFSFTFDANCYETGMAFKFYTGKNKAHNYTIGSLYLGVNTIRYYLGPEFMYISRNDINYTSLRFQNGVSIQSKKHINITIHTGIGAGYVLNEKVSNSEYYQGDIIFDWNFSLNLGYRF